MKARLVNNFYSGTYKDSWLVRNADNVVNGVLVSEWVVIDTIPTESELNTLIRPLWNGSAYIEGATQAEQDEINALRNEEEDREENVRNISDSATVMNEYNQRLIRKLKNAELDESDVKTIRNRIKGIYESLVFGWWDVAKEDAASMSTGGAPQVSDELVYFQDLIVNF